MKMKLALAAFLSSALFLADGKVYAVGSDEQQLKKIEQDWAEAYVKRDPTFVQRITADDYTFIGPDGAMVIKADYVKSITGDTMFTAFKLDELKVRIYGEAAVVIGLTTVTTKNNGEDESGTYAFTDVFVKQKGEWKAVSGQVTPVAKDEATD